MSNVNGRQTSDPGIIEAESGKSLDANMRFSLYQNSVQLP